MVDTETFEAVLADVRAGVATRRAIVDHGVSARAFYSALDADEGMAERYARARASSMDAIADDAMQIADDPEIDPNHKRIMVDSRKWFLSKLAPKRYGDKLAVGGEDGPMEMVIRWASSKS